MNKRKIRIAVVRREPVDLDRLALALLALVEQILSEEDETGDDVEDPGVNGNDIPSSNVNETGTMHAAVDGDVDGNSTPDGEDEVSP